MKEEKMNQWEDVITSTDLIYNASHDRQGSIRLNLYKHSVSGQRQPSRTAAAH